MALLWKFCKLLITKQVFGEVAKELIEEVGKEKAEKEQKTWQMI